ncbi:ABC transporter ATP-binding protein [Sporolactobacillus pectinivorans]|uniref:ABC transporter ATP-binding protein n=1 Tax=Sporolactobacillus pectinivorans TaxID=1591408 RepID=UPI000C2616CC|nr:ABC transporter ATP-binding protein [Sporolactobacillus pectinivorans]
MQDYLEHYPHELSGGQKQRIAIARTIAVSPRLILMDEPLSALDNVFREEMRVELVRIFKRLRMTVIYVTHDQEEAMSMADEIVLLKDGQCEQIGTPEMLYKNPVSRYAAKFMGHANFLQKDGESAVRFIRPDDIQLVPNEAEGKKGKIIMRSYLSGYYRYFVKISDYKDPLEFTSQQKLEMESLVQVDIPANRCFQL